jgi:diaminopimelate epimerase
MAAPLVGDKGAGVTRPGRTFYKMSGSGNDFVFFDVGELAAGALESPEAVRAISARRTGVGADGVVFLEPRSEADFAIRYYNSDGSLGELCGNATLCALKLATDRGMVSANEVSIHTDAGLIHARMTDGYPEIDLAPVTEVRTDAAAIPRLEREASLGFARVGVPHIVIVDENVATADVQGRGSSIRRDPSLRDGANVNFVTKSGSDWQIRTYERGVEGETLACGTGAVATGILLTEWGRATSPVGLITRSGRRLEVTVRRAGASWIPSLKGPAELVFEGQLRELDV